MIKLRLSEDRGTADYGWLRAKYSFSFARYFDPEHVQFRSLRVINEDRIDGGRGFDTHPHNDMEILTWVLEGRLHHKDSMGFAGDLEPGQIQRISAGTGISHSEANASPNESLHLLQIWMIPDKAGHKPSYDQKTISPESRQNKLALVAAPVGNESKDAVLVHQDTYLYVADISKGHQVEHAFEDGRHGYIQVAKGKVSVNGQALNQGDAVMLSQEALATIEAGEDSQVLLFDLA